MWRALYIDEFSTFKLEEVLYILSSVGRKLSIWLNVKRDGKHLPSLDAKVFRNKLIIWIGYSLTNLEGAFVVKKNYVA